MTSEEIEFAKLFSTCISEGIASIKTCYYPNCKDKSINSHILHKNGILSSIAPNNHLWELEINNFKKPQFQFKRTGINRIYSFNCFCNYHDTELFRKIEGTTIDFNDYESCLLFTLRTIYNEIFRKQVNLKTYDCLLNKRPEIFKTPRFLERVRQENLGLKDLLQTEKDIWGDLKNDTKSFVFENRKLQRIELCLSAFYHYDTIKEMNDYILKYGKDMDRVSGIFINFFPIKDNSILLMGYNKKDEAKLKGYFYTFFKEQEKKVQRKVTNLILFRCETWVASDNFYKEKIAGIEGLYANVVSFSTKNINERQTFDLNFFADNFRDKLKNWNINYFEPQRKLKVSDIQ